MAKMFTASLIVVYLVALGLVIGSGADAIGASPDVTRIDDRVRPHVIVSHGDDTQRAEVGAALARFASAGLQLPDVEVVFSASEDDCGGHLGLFQPQFSPWRISVCSDLPFVTTHELAHAWEAANLTEEGRIRYVRARHLTSWSDPQARWDDRGVEDAAFIIQQYLMSSVPAVPTPTWTEKVAAYHLLTNLASAPGREAPVSRDRSSDRCEPEWRQTDRPPGRVDFLQVHAELTGVFGHWAFVRRPWQETPPSTPAAPRR